MSAKKIHILQLGNLDWSQSTPIPENMEWHWIRDDQIEEFVAADKALKKKNKKLREEGLEVTEKEVHYSALLVTSTAVGEAIKQLGDFFAPYEVFYPERFRQMPLTQDLEEFLTKKLAQTVNDDDREALFIQMSKRLFSGQYGAKLHMTDIVLAPDYNGKKWYEGKQYFHLLSDFGREFRPLAQFRYNIAITKDVPLKLWLEYQATAGIELQLHVSLFPSGSPDYIAKDWTFDSHDMEKQVEIDADVDGVLAFSIYAKGAGDLKLGALHYRFSRGQWGDFILGGQVFADKNRQEFISYFSPGDFKPPLNVYFSGFRGAEGFEGYWMMRNMGAPFLLFSDPRLEGGGFYLGSEEYEQAIVDRVKECLDYLGFTNEQLIFSGISMGTYGSLYYSTRIQPHAIIIAKPLANLGTIGENERLNRPNVFPTSLDLLKIHGGADVSLAVEKLNNRFWDKFREVTYDKTTLALSYMKNDDYDDKAFYQLVEESQHNQSKIIGKGWLGRHNDNSTAVTVWFVQQYRRILDNDFGRGNK